MCVCTKSGVPTRPSGAWLDVSRRQAIKCVARGGSECRSGGRCDICAIREPPLPHQHADSRVGARRPSRDGGREPRPRQQSHDTMTRRAQCACKGRALPACAVASCGIRSLRSLPIRGDDRNSTECAPPRLFVLICVETGTSAIHVLMHNKSIVSPFDRRVT